jgi:alpha-1,4-digalacturonate transport system permease protein
MTTTGQRPAGASTANEQPARPLRRRDVDGGAGFGLYAGVMRFFGLAIEPIGKRIGRRRMAWVFLLPNMAFFTLFHLVPIVLLGYYSLSSGASIFADNRTFVGADNYQAILTCGNYLDPNSCNTDLFWRGVWNTIGYMFFEVLAIMVLALVTALVLNEKIRARGFFRSVFFYPVLLSPVIVALVWKWILQQEGVLNAGLGIFGAESVNWLLDPGWSRFWVIVATVWSTFGFYTLIILAGLQGINPQLYDAARVDAANTWQRFRDITLPLLRPTLLVAFMLAFIRAVQVFDVPFVLTGGGPGSQNLFIVQYIYQVGFASSVRNYGMAATASVLLALVLVATSYVQMRLDRKASGDS